MFVYSKCNFELFESNYDVNMTLVSEIHAAVESCLYFWLKVANKIFIVENIYSLSEKKMFLIFKIVLTLTRRSVIK